MLQPKEALLNPLYFRFSGIYVNARNKLAYPEFHGLGIRIEDDVLVTKNGPVVLTRNCPKEISEVEDLAKKNQF